MNLRRRLSASALAVLALSVVGLGACGDGEDRPGQVTADDHDHQVDSKPAFPASDADTQVEVDLVNYRFKDLPEKVKGPKLFFALDNDSSTDHELVIRPPGGGASIGGVGPFRSGVKQLAVGLPPGVYEVVCLVSEGAKTHADLGMKATLTVE